MENNNELKLSQEITLEQLLNLNGIKKITSIDGLMDIENLDEDKMPRILTIRASIIVFDNSIFNSTYLLDLINDFINENQISDNPLNMTDVDIYYCDSVLERLRVTRPDISGIKELDEVGGDISKLHPAFIEKIEKNLLHPGFIFINPNINHIGMAEEGWIPFNSGNVKDLFSLVIKNKESLATDRKAQVVKDAEEKQK